MDLVLFAATLNQSTEPKDYIKHENLSKTIKKNKLFYLKQKLLESPSPGFAYSLHEYHFNNYYEVVKFVKNKNWQTNFKSGCRSFGNANDFQIVESESKIILFELSKYNFYGITRLDCDCHSATFNFKLKRENFDCEETYLETNLFHPSENISESRISELIEKSKEN